MNTFTPCRKRGGIARAICNRNWRGRSRTGEPVPPLWPIAVGAYFPLHTTAGAQALLAAVMAALCATPCSSSRSRSRARARDRRDHPRLDRHRRRGVAGGARSNTRRTPTRAGSKPAPPVQPHILKDTPPDQVPDVLIAGCGTGLSTIEFARQTRRAAHPGHRSQPRQPQLRQAHGGKFRSRQHRIRAGRHHDAGRDRPAIRFHRRIGRPASSRRSLGTAGASCCRCCARAAHAGRAV